MLTKRQQTLVDAVRENPGLSTRGLRKSLFPNEGQAYEQTLVERLILLADKGLLRFEEEKGPSGGVKSRRWFATSEGEK